MSAEHVDDGSTVQQTWAQMYASNGVAVFPVKPRGKAPITTHGLDDATTDTDRVRGWWQTTPDANVAINLQMADRWALDVDGPAAKAALDDLQRAYGKLPDTYTVITGRPEGHGRHLIWQQPDDGGPRIRNGNLGRLAGEGFAGAEHLDVKGDGGYVIAPPSVHASGRPYLSQGKWSQAEVPPAWLAGLVRRCQEREEAPPPPFNPPRPEVDGEPRRRAQARMDGLCGHLAAMSPDTGRNNALNHAAYVLGQLVAVGVLDESEAQHNLNMAATACGLVRDDGPRSVAATIHSGLTSGRTAPDYDALNVTPAVPQVTVLRVDPQRESDFWQSRPILKHVREYARARRTSPWAVLGVVLLRIMATVPPHYVLPPIIGGPASLNLFLAVVARSGGGKGASEAAAADAVNVGEEIRTSGVGSGEGILHQYVHHVPENKRTGDPARVEQHTTSVLFTASEVDTLAALHARQSSTLLSGLRQLYMGEELSFAYVDPTKRLKLERHGYRAGLVVGVQPARAGVLLDDRDGGTPQRFLWLPGRDAEMPQTAPPTPDRWTWTWPSTAKLTGDPFTGRIAIPVCDLARSTIDSEHVKRNHGEGDALDGHRLLTHLKWAAALGISDERIEVSEEDWHLAGTVMEISDATRNGIVAELAEERMRANTARGHADAERDVIREETVAEAAVQRVCRLVMKRLEGGERGRADLRRTLASPDRGYFDAAIDRLLAAGQITSADGVTAFGSAITTYRQGAVT
jgi:hypothetical protein